MWWDDKAARVQQGVRYDENKLPIESHDEDTARRATVHMREDVVLLVSYLSSVNRQLWYLRILVATAILCLLVEVVHHW